MNFNLASQNRSLLKPGARIRLLGSIIGWPQRRLRAFCEREGLVWTTGNHPDLLVIGQQSRIDRRTKEPGVWGNHHHLEQIPAITMGRLIEYLARTDREREQRVHETNQALANAAASKTYAMGF